MIHLRMFVELFNLTLYVHQVHSHKGRYKSLIHSYFQAAKRKTRRPAPFKITALFPRTIHAIRRVHPLHRESLLFAGNKRIERNGENQQHAGREILIKRRDGTHVQTVADKPEDQRADDHAGNGSFTAEEAR
jgi:hypothetical protein